MLQVSIGILPPQRGILPPNKQANLVKSLDIRISVILRYERQVSSSFFLSLFKPTLIHLLAMSSVMSWPQLPVAEQTQDFWFGFPSTALGYDIGTRRAAPAEPPFIQWDPIYGGWWQGPRKLRNFRPNKHWTRPHDGKRPGAIGRLKDALTNKGADVFVTLSGDTRTLHRDRPQRWQWTNDGLTDEEVLERRAFDKDHRLQDEMPPSSAPWTWSREVIPNYNFRNRRYERTSPRMLDPGRFWADAHWAPGAKSGDIPLSYKDVSGRWSTRVPCLAGMFPGGRPRPPI